MLRILTIDDHAIVRDGVKKIFEAHHGKAVFGEASTSEEALRLVHEGEWDVAILELSLAGRSGLGVLRDLKAARPAMPLVVLSMHTEEEYARRAFRAGASAYVTKESPVTELVEAVDRVLAGRVYASSTITEQMITNLGRTEKTTRHESLSDREFEVLRLIAAGKTITEIGRMLNLSDKTISTYRARLMQKLGLKTNAALMHYAIQSKLVD
jgi:two-component system, NarL family, invasion response regulator UvrY